MTPLPPSQRPSPVTLRAALLYWLKLGLISFGGPAGQIAMMHAELVEKRRWISERRFLHALNYCMVLPGPEATQLAIYIGWLMHRGPGGILAGLLFIFPSLLLLITLSWIYLAYGHVTVIAGILYGIKPAVVAIVLAAAWRVGQRTLHSKALIVIAIAALLAITLMALPFPLIVLIAAALGALGARFMPAQFDRQASSHHKPAASYGLALIDDDTPTPAHAQWSRQRLFLTIGSGLFLGLGSWLAIAAMGGVQGTLAQIGWFFSKAALLTFGGAYAVLPYVYQGAVNHFHWLDAAQMMDGLALGETTPGPLIMIVAFVGFVAGWGQQLFGTHLFAAGVAGACVATFFTFLPSFIFILVGGPLVESSRNTLRLTAPLTAISAAVVGVIVSLAFFFASHVFHLALAVRQWDWVAILITAAASLATLRFQITTIPLIAACAMAGLVLSYWS